MELLELSQPSSELAKNIAYYYSDVYNYRNRKQDKNPERDIDDQLQNAN